MRLPRLFRPRGRHRAPAAAPFTPVGITDGTTWRTCDTTTCGHNQAPHVPTTHGWECTDCHTLKGDPS